MPESRFEWAARYTHYDRTVTHEIATDRGHAELIADGKATHLASLNEPTREYGGISEVDVVSRHVIVEDDGTTITRPWHFERPGLPEREPASRMNR